MRYLQPLKTFGNFLFKRFEWRPFGSSWIINLPREESVLNNVSWMSKENLFNKLSGDTVIIKGYQKITRYTFEYFYRILTFRSIHIIHALQRSCWNKRTSNIRLSFFAFYILSGHKNPVHLHFCSSCLVEVILLNYALRFSRDASQGKNTLCRQRDINSGENFARSAVYRSRSILSLSIHSLSSMSLYGFNIFPAVYHLIP